MATLTEATIKKVVRNLILPGMDYRAGIIDYINSSFLDFTISFFMRVARAKIAKKKINIDWYKAAFLDKNASSIDIATNAGINLKTISNIHGTAAKQVVINAAHENYETTKELIESLIKAGEDIQITITIKFNDVSVDLDISESLIVINALAVKRASMRGGAWSSVGKQSEKPLMLALCHLYSVSPTNYDIKQIRQDSPKEYERESDFFLINDNKRYKCEVKLMGKGNPESADHVFAKSDNVFVADTLSLTNIKQLNAQKIEWVHLKSESGYLRFATVLKNLKIPHTPHGKHSEKEIDAAIKKAFAFLAVLPSAPKIM